MKGKDAARCSEWGCLYLCVHSFCDLLKLTDRTPFYCEVISHLTSCWVNLCMLVLEVAENITIMPCDFEVVWNGSFKVILDLVFHRSFLSGETFTIPPPSATHGRRINANLHLTCKWMQIARVACPCQHFPCHLQANYAGNRCQHVRSCLTLPACTFHLVLGYDTRACLGYCCAV